MAKVGLVTVLYNSNNVLEGFFKSLLLQDFFDYTLYLIDNSPGIETENILEQLVGKYNLPDVIHIRNLKNSGVAAGNNKGIELALQDGCKYILLLNNDIEFDQPFLISEMVQCAGQKHEQIIIPKILYFGTRTIWMAGGSINKYKAISAHEGFNAEDSDSFTQPAYFDYAPTCFMLLNSTVFNKLGLMDEQYFVYYDDTDFLYRAIKAGLKVYLMPLLEVFHKVSSSTGGGESLFSIYYLNRNRLYFIRKNLHFPEKQISLIYTFLTRLIWLFRYPKPERKAMLNGVKAGLKLQTNTGTVI